MLLESVTDFLRVKERPELCELVVTGAVDTIEDVVKSNCRFFVRLRVVLRISEFSKGIDTVEITGS